jgi:hypothetical protein
MSGNPELCSRQHDNEAHDGYCLAKFQGERREQDVRRSRAHGENHIYPSDAVNSLPFDEPI